MTYVRPALVGYEIRPVLMKMQQGRCAVCPSTGPLVVDHDHETGLVRGLLCRGCNVREGQWGSGMFSVAPDALMLAYLANPPAAGKGWLWDYPDPRRNPARAKADMELAFAWLATAKLPPLESPDAPTASESAPEGARAVQSPAESPRQRKRRQASVPVGAEEAVAALQLIELPPLNV